MALLVEHPVDALLSRAARILFDLRDGPEFIGDEGSQGIGVVPGVRDHMPDTFQPEDQALCLWPVAPMSGGDHEPDRKPQSIDGGMDLCRQTAAGTADCGSFKPPF